MFILCGLFNFHKAEKMYFGEGEDATSYLDRELSEKSHEDSKHHLLETSLHPILASAEPSSNDFLTK